MTTEPRCSCPILDNDDPAFVPGSVRSSLCLVHGANLRRDQDSDGEPITQEAEHAPSLEAEGGR